MLNSVTANLSERLAQRPSRKLTASESDDAAPGTEAPRNMNNGGIDNRHAPPWWNSPVIAVVLASLIGGIGYVLGELNTQQHEIETNRASISTVKAQDNAEFQALNQNVQLLMSRLGVSRNGK